MRISIFSDDIQYAKEVFGPSVNYHYVHLLGGMDADLDEFFCISACNGRILTQQSSFSYWATELSQSKNQINIGQNSDYREKSTINQIYLTQEAIEALSAHYHTSSQPLLHRL